MLTADDRVMREIEDALRIAERSGDDLALAFARLALGVALVHRQAAGDRDNALALIRAAVDHLLGQGQLLGWGIPATGVLVETKDRDLGRVPGSSTEE